MIVELFYFADEIVVTRRHGSKTNKGYTQKSKSKKAKVTKSEKKDKKTKVKKKNIEKDEVLRPKSTKFYHRLLNIFCCCCCKTQESKDLQRNQQEK